MQKVIILRGTPASGKSTIAKKYRNFTNKFVWLKVDNFKEFFADDAALPYVNGSAVVTLKYLLENGFSVIMEGVFQETVAIDKAKEIATSLNIPLRIFELRVPLNVLQERDLIREGVPEGKRPALGAETIERIYNKLINTSYPGAIKLDTQQYNLKACIEIIDKSFE